jgi:DNA (cytosine-5)-methyltransferase 1
MKHISLFSGIGGFDLAAQWMGWENVAHCEWNPFGQRVLKYYWPNSISYHDITKTDFTIHRGTIDIVTGGFPCQPYSVAGKRKGKEDERHLWPEMLRAIREIQPRWVVGENVRGIINWDGGLVFNEVQANLEAEGYKILPFLLPAASVNAPHERYRTWFVAYRSDAGIQSLQSGRQDGVYGSKYASDTYSIRRNHGRYNWKERRIQNHIDRNASKTQSERLKWISWVSALRSIRNASNTTSTRQPSKEHGKAESGWTTEKSIPDDWENFPTQPPVRYGNDGLSSESLRQRIRDDSMGIISKEEIDKILHQADVQCRNESIKAGGNAIVPQVVYQIFKAIEAYDTQ